jgi:hypothetical protein
MVVLRIQIHLAKRFLAANFGINYAYVNNLKGLVYFYERKFKAPTKSSDEELNERLFYYRKTYALICN